MIFFKAPKRLLTLHITLSWIFSPFFIHHLYAAEVIDYLREYDLNDYALGLTYSVSESPYLNAESSNIVFPHLTNLRNPAFTEDWLVITDGNLGVRWVSDNGLVLGAAGRVETLGLGSTRSPELIGLEDRQWSWELAPMISWRAWPVQFNFRAYKEVLGRHGGLTSELSISLPFEWSRGYVVPSIEYIHHNDKFMKYYYGVSEDEANPYRSSYDPSSAGNLAADVAWGYRFNDLWLLSGRFSLEWLPNEIKNSPIVDKDSLWSFSVGLAYNVDLFQTPLATVDSNNKYQRPRIEMRMGLFQNNSNTRIVRNNDNGFGGEVINLQDVFGISKTKSLNQFDVVLRMGQYHRLQLGYFELARDSQTILNSDLSIGDTTFLAGSQTTVNTDTSVARVSYGYSLINDEQKEMGVLAGIHSSKIKASVASIKTGKQESFETNSPLPVIGAFFIVDLNDQLSIGIQGEFFRLQFDDYDGAVTMINFNIQHQVIDNISLGLGYNYYKVKINSDNSSINGQIQGNHKGPYLSIGLSF